ncbi:alpha/beta-hydrolase [Microthyrium microscopicum]|uniref:Carboxylic ester hydrolase n=1 Tax=Microthyrium microscopicum TaxID=703497 RepID=A0A6A6USU4_9PEZI|nr:alpha/beta-hydrolase [Microthyrium microscopicum]
MYRLLITLVFGSSVVAAQPTFKVGDGVKTTSGTVIGQASKWQPQVSEYLGIPFAKAPEGELRWAAPQAITDSSKTINATKYGFACPESASRLSQGVPGAAAASGASDVKDQREDCLNLNIYTKPQTGEKKKAVLVWIYGGGFVYGSNENPAYNGALMAEENDVVSVAINYRLHVLGFPGVGIPEKNPALLDQRLALEWVRDNIEKFGGDPKRIIIHGQSAGGASVDYYSYAWTKDPIVYGFIPQSGTAAIRMSAGTGNATANAINQWSTLSDKLGCGAVTAEDVTKTLSCMRSKPLKAVMDATAPAAGQQAMGSWGPKVDGKTVFEDLADRGAKGNFIKAPIFVGNTNNEGQGQLGSKAALASNCGPRRAAQLRKDAGVPAWRYIYAGEFENQKKGPCRATTEGACHSAEISIVFGSNPMKGKGTDTENEKKLSKELRKAWTEFAKDPAHGLEKMGWPQYDKSKPSVIVMGGKDSAEIKFESVDKLDTECPA